MSSTKGLLSGAARLRNELNPDTPPEESNDSNDEQGNHLNDYGELRLPEMHGNIHVITIIGQVEGHLIMPSQNKATKYEHIIPQLVAVEQSPEIEGLLVILNTVGGDVEAGLALAEIIASMSKPTVSLVLGGGHSIGVPIAVAADYSFIAPTATMTIHPIRLTGMVVGVQQSFDYLEKMQDRIIDFVARHSHISAAQFRQMMTTTGELARDVGTVVVGEAAAECGLIDETGGLSQAMDKLRQMIEDHKASEQGQEARIDPPREKAPADKPGPIFKRPHRDWRKGEKP